MASGGCMANESNEAILELYRQSWDQSRHNEHLRETYTTFVGAIVFGVLTFLQDEPDTLHYLFLLLAALTFSSYMISLRTWFTTRRWLVTQTRIQRKLSLVDYIVLSPNKLSPISKALYVSARFDMTYLLIHGLGTLLFCAAFFSDFSFSEGVKLSNLDVLDIGLLSAIAIGILWLWRYFRALVEPFEQEIHG